MLGFRNQCPSVLPSIAAAALVLSVLTPAASYAASAERHIDMDRAHIVAQPDARAQYPGGRAYPFGYGDPNGCIGGYRWVQRFDDANQTPAQSEVPLPCR